MTYNKFGGKLMTLGGIHIGIIDGVIAALALVFGLSGFKNGFSPFFQIKRFLWVVIPHFR